MAKIELDDNYKSDATDGYDCLQGFSVDGVHGTVYEFSTDISRTTIVSFNGICYFRTIIFGTNDFSCYDGWVSSEGTQIPEWLHDLYYIV